MPPKKELSAEHQALLKQIYFDPKLGLASAEALYQRAKAQGVTRSDVKTFFSKLEGSQLHERKQKPVHDPIVTLAPNELWESDLIDYSTARYANFNYQNKYIFITKRTWGYPLVNKKPEMLLPLFKALVEKEGAPTVLMTDDGGEYKGVFSNYLKEKEIAHVINKHAPHAERVIQTIKHKLSRYFSANHTLKWKAVLPDILENYNTSKHSTIGKAPDTFDPKSEHASVVRGEMLSKAEVKNEATKKLRLPALNIGDQVRIASRSNPFEKGYAQQWSKDIYSVSYKEGSLYKVDNRKHVFKRYQLKKAGDDMIEYERPKAERAEPTIYDKAVPALQERQATGGRNKITSRRVLEGFQ
jgi:hypothetical protein